jgi:glycerol-3-phosphate dehydrogenase (NAD(P)+)
MMQMTRGEIAVIGGGSWGTGLAFYLSRIGHAVRLWVRRRELVDEIRRTRENKLYLPGFQLPASVAVDCDAAKILAGAGTIVSVVPSHTVREIFSRLRPHIQPGAAILSATKGIENETSLLMSSVILEVLGKDLSPQIAALSGPSFALEVARGDPTALVVAAQDHSLARSFQRAFSGENVRIYTNTDLIGTQIGGAVKNIVAIAAGIVAGLGYGSNTGAALITRGLAEVKRLCVAAGGKAETLSGLAGLGDLVLTSTGILSRNRSLGVELGKGRKLHDILEGTRFVAEGVKTTRSTVTLAQRLKVEMPITEQMNEVLYAGKSPLEAIQALMERELKSESGN